MGKLDGSPIIIKLNSRFMKTQLHHVRYGIIKLTGYTVVCLLDNERYNCFVLILMIFVYFCLYLMIGKITSTIEIRSYISFFAG